VHLSRLLTVASSIVYKPGLGAKTYRPVLEPAAHSGPPIDIVVGESAPETEKAKPLQPPRLALPNAIHVWTDGGAADHPGPSVAGVVTSMQQTIEMSSFSAMAHQVSELTAILMGLSNSRPASPRHRLLSWGRSAVLDRAPHPGWKAKAKSSSSRSCAACAAEFKDLGS